MPKKIENRPPDPVFLRTSLIHNDLSRSKFNPHTSVFIRKKANTFTLFGRWESANTVHGRTNNPYNTNHIVGGSSGGEGCNQGAAGSAFGIGSDIGGSIRMPAFFNGVFGHKPSKNIVSSKGQYPIPVTQEQNSFLGEDWWVNGREI